MAQQSSISKADNCEESLAEAITRIAERLNGKTKLGPVDRKVFVVIHQRLLELQEALRDASAAVKGHDEKILATSVLINDSLSGDAAWDVADALKEILPLIASEEYLYRSLLEEKVRRNDDGNLTKCFEARSIDESINAFEKVPDGERTKDVHIGLVRQKLAALYAFRNDDGRHRRAREGLRVEYLRLVVIVLFILLVASVVSPILFAGRTDLMAQAVVVFLSGGLGSLLSGVLRIRDLDRITQLDAVWRTLLFQTVLGGTLATIVLLVLRAQLVKFGSVDMGAIDLVTVYVIGFISGFSEPFALGLLEKITAVGR